MKVLAYINVTQFSLKTETELKLVIHIHQTDQNEVLFIVFWRFFFSCSDWNMIYNSNILNGVSYFLWQI